MSASLVGSEMCIRDRGRGRQSTRITGPGVAQTRRVASPLPAAGRWRAGFGELDVRGVGREPLLAVAVAT
eukprot:11700865-Alexandrium_andersonii.AAC.1